MKLVLIKGTTEEMESREWFEAYVWVNLQAWLVQEMSGLREESRVIPEWLPDFSFGDEFVKLFCS